MGWGHVVLEARDRVGGCEGEEARMRPELRGLWWSAMVRRPGDEGFRTDARWDGEAEVWLGTTPPDFKLRKPGSRGAIHSLEKDHILLEKDNGFGFRYAV